MNILINVCVVKDCGVGDLGTPGVAHKVTLVVVQGHGEAVYPPAPLAVKRGLGDVVAEVDQRHAVVHQVTDGVQLGLVVVPDDDGPGEVCWEFCRKK